MSRARGASVPRWIRDSVYHRVGAAAVALALAVLAAAGLGSYALSRSLLRRAIDQRLDAEEALDTGYLGRALNGLVQEVGQLSRNPLLSTALVDQEGRGRYVGPFLRGFRTSVPGTVRVALCDERGSLLLATSTPDPPSLSGTGWVDPVVARGENRAELHEVNGRSHLFVAFPVRLPDGSSIGGAVAVELDLDGLQESMPPGKIVGMERVLVDGRGRSLNGARLDGGAGWIRRASRLDLSEPLTPLGLELAIAVPAAAAFAPLRWLSLGFAAFALATVGLALAAARRMADRLTRPLRDLSATIGQIASSGSLDTSVPVSGKDEIAQLATSFNQMLRKLQEAQLAGRRLHEAQSQRTRSALRIALLAIEKASEAILIARPDGTVVFANDAAARMAGLEGTMLATLKLWEIDRGLTEESWKRDWEILRQRGSLQRERTLSGPGGSTMNVEVSDSYLGAENMEYCVSIRRDVTARRQAEVALRLAGVGTLAAGAAHEINNPLAFIGSNMAFLRETLERLRGELPQGGAAQALEEAVQAARESEEGARRIREIVAGLNTFTRRRDDRREPIDIRRAVAAAIRLVRNEIRHRARLVERISDEVPAVIGSQHRIEQVVVNLLVNAAQAIPEGAAETNTITVTLSRTASGAAAIEVADTGCGMAPDVRGRIFEPFFTTKPVGSGTGLGLYVCHGIVSELGGHIEVESEAGKGSTFRVILPGSATASEQPAGPPAEAVAGRVLVVDDDPSVGASIRRLLSPGQEVVLATDAREALGRIARGEIFELVICDLMMPGISGMEFHETLTRMAPELARDMIFMTGGAFTPRARTFLAESTHAWIEKPFAPEALRSLVSEKLAAHQRR